MQMEVASYVELCTRLSRFVQLQPADTTVKELTHVLGDVLALYDRVESCDDSVRPAVDSPLVTFAAMDDLVLLSMHRLLGGFVLNSSSPKLQERAFAVFSRVLQRCKPRMSEGNAAHLQRRLAFVQSCVLYLPQPPEAKEDSEETAESATFTSQPEELRLAILQSLRELLEEDTAEKKSLQLQADQQHFFAYLVASLLHVAQRDRCREAALRAVEVLECVLVFIRDPNTLRQYLPGVSAGLWKCANAPQQISKEGQLRD
ncbi:TEL2-interacting protein 1 [Phytophthora boehmeriae]|uniref:TEL2-interacting protein 1 n=1 Tax=Phytophthora boehmeriae TaxID=109152 RepID=A0A8T1VS95_9STRA|nr:TEL2-interacting protein 1 [Phytophthora boehmeriae]